MIKRTIAGLAVLGVLALSGCGGSQAQWSTQSIRGVMPDLAFTLTDEHGNAVQASEYRGKYTLLFFGYTHCPDICPATLSVLGAALRQLGDGAQRVTVLFVSVDPKRDGPRELREYTSSFGPGIVGLTGTPDELDALTKRYRVTYRYGVTDEDGNYPVYHSAAIFAFDPDGRVRLLMNYTDGVPAIAHDLQQLVESGDS
jgi:protein SCO1/2